jgi:hypothetical protein
VSLNSSRKKVPGGQQTVAPVGAQCFAAPFAHAPAQGTYTFGVPPSLYSAVTSASDIA